MASSAHHDRQTREEASMAEITFNTAHQEERVREQIKTAVAAYREMLDTFVSDGMRQVAAEAEQVRPRQPPSGSSPSIKTR
jgi:ABC-type enterochelin transport system substrate-binding protein